MDSIGQGTKRAIIALALAGTAGTAIYFTYTRLKKRHPEKAKTSEKAKEEQTSVKEVVPGPGGSAGQQATATSTSPKTGPASSQQNIPKSSASSALPEVGLSESTGPGSGSTSMSSSFVHVDTPPTKTVSTAAGKEERFKAKDENDIVVIEKDKSHGSPSASSKGAGDSIKQTAAARVSSINTKEIAKPKIESPGSNRASVRPESRKEEHAKKDTPKETLPASSTAASEHSVSKQLPKSEAKQETSSSKVEEEEEEDSSESEEEEEEEEEEES